MKYDFDSVIDRIHAPYSYSVKWAETGAAAKRITEMCGGDIPSDRLSLFLADMDFKCAPAITEALVKTAQHGIFGYSTAPAAYYDAVVRWFRDRFDWNISPDHIFVGPSGTHELIAKCVKTFTQPGDGIIVLLPSYGYRGDIIPLGREFVGVPMINTDSYFTIDWDAFEAACAQERNTMFIMMQPHNPTGRVFTVEELEKIAAICRKHNVLIFTDDVHIDIVRKGKKAVPLMKAVGPQGVIAATAVNKTFNVAGLSMSNLIIEDEVLYEKYVKENFYMGGASPFGISAVIAAYTQCDDWVDELNEYLDNILTYAVDRIHKDLPKVKVTLPEGTYILWADFSGLGLSDDELARRFGTTHIMAGEGTGLDATTTPRQWRRICLTCPMSQVVDMCDRLVNAFGDC